MRTARIDVDGQPQEGTLEGDEIVTEEGSYPVDAVELLPPCEPTKVIGAGMNYRDHITEMAERKGEEPNFPDLPYLFFKPPSAVTGPNDSIRYPPDAEHVEFEGEVGVVIDERCRNIDAEDADQFLRGYTCVNDVSWRDWLQHESQWVRQKGTDTFCPIGPVIQTEMAEPIDIETRLNGETVQSSSTEHLIFSIPELVAECSRFMTLMPGDVIATGTPAGVSKISVGDTIEVEVERVGTLVNDVEPE